MTSLRNSRNSPVGCSGFNGTREVEVVKIKLIMSDYLKGSRYVIKIIDNIGNEVGRVYVEGLGSKLNLRTLVWKVKVAIERKFFTKGGYAYRILPGAQGEISLINAVKDAIQKGASELEVGKHYGSAAEIALQEVLLKNKLKFKWRAYLEDYLVDFHILGGNSIVVDIIEGDHQQVPSLKEKMHRLVNGGHIYYWLEKEKILRSPEKYVEIIKEILKRRKIYPNGLLVEELKLDETVPPVEILVKLQTVNIPSGINVRFINVFEISKADATILGSAKISRKLWTFAKSLSNILWEKGYYYDVGIERYADIFNKLMQFGEVKFSVSRIAKKVNSTFSEEV